jgi:hypothetical protein
MDSPAGCGDVCQRKAIKLAIQDAKQALRQRFACKMRRHVFCGHVAEGFYALVTGSRIWWCGSALSAASRPSANHSAMDSPAGSRDIFFVTTLLGIIDNDR